MFSWPFLCCSFKGTGSLSYGFVAGEAADSTQWGSQGRKLRNEEEKGFLFVYRVAFIAYDLLMKNPREGFSIKLSDEFSGVAWVEGLVNHAVLVRIWCPRKQLEMIYIYI